MTINSALHLDLPSSAKEAANQEVDFFQDGTYSRGLGHVSPEGNVYGHIRMVRDVEHFVWWDGLVYRYVDVVGEVKSVSELPDGAGRPFGETWLVLERVITGTQAELWWEYYWDSEVSEWRRIQWLWEVDALSELPQPGLKKGAGHKVVEPDVPHFWDGFEWRRIRHSSLEDDEEERHLPAGFLTTLQPDVRVIYLSPTEIGIEPAVGGIGKVWVNGEYVFASREASVYNDIPVLNWDDSTETLSTTTIQPNTEYWIYLANSDNAFNLTERDFREKLFLSLTSDYRHYWGQNGTGQNARLAGRVETDGTVIDEGGPYFIREIELDRLNPEVSLPETYREYSDFRLEFLAPDTLKFSRIPNTYGQVYVAGSLVYLGNGYQMNCSDAWVEWDQQGDPRVIRHTTPLNPDTLYHCYLAGLVDPFNFNDINPETGRPWTQEDLGAETHYVDAKDLRLKLFLSPQPPDHGVLDESWPGYAARHVGQVWTDGNGLFVDANNLSSIRQPTLDPTYFDGLAEVQMEWKSVSEIQIYRRPGTSGIVMVGSLPVPTYPEDDTDVHKILTTDQVQTYTESNSTDPLSDAGVASGFTNTDLYVYLANTRSLWGDRAGRLFLTTTAPSGGLLSQNWPGNQARWMITVHINESGELDGEWADGLRGMRRHSNVLDDEPEKHRLINDADNDSHYELWSAYKINAEIMAVYANVGDDQIELGKERTFEVQKRVGLPLRLEYSASDKVTAFIVSDEACDIVFPNNSKVTLAIDKSYTFAPGYSYVVDTVHYVYLKPTGALDVTTISPDKEAEALRWRSSDGALLVGWLVFASTSGLGGSWNVCSASYEPVRTWDCAINSISSGYAENVPWGGSTTLSLPGLLIPSNWHASAQRTGHTSLIHWVDHDEDNIGQAIEVRGSVTVLLQQGAPHVVWRDPTRLEDNEMAFIDYPTIYFDNNYLADGIYNGVTLYHDLDGVVGDDLGSSSKSGSNLRWKSAVGPFNVNGKTFRHRYNGIEYTYTCSLTNPVSANSLSSDMNAAWDKSIYTDFYIKEHLDGSISIFKGGGVSSYGRGAFDYILPVSNDMYSELGLTTGCYTTVGHTVDCQDINGKIILTRYPWNNN